MTLSWLEWISFSINLDIFSLPFIGCVMAGNYVNKLASMTVMPIVIIGAMLFAMRCGKMHPHRVRRNSTYLLFLSYPQVTKRLPVSPRRLVFASFPGLLFAWPLHSNCYAQICSTIMGAFHCLELANGSARLVADLKIICDDAYKHSMYPFAVALFIIYSLGVPALFWWQLRRYGVYSRTQKHAHARVHRTAAHCTARNITPQP